MNKAVKSNPTPPGIELLSAPPPILRRPLACIDGHTYAAAWLYVRETHDPSAETTLRRFIVRDDGALFGEGGDYPLAELACKVVLPERPRASRTWSTAGVKAYRAGLRPDPIDVFTRVTETVDRFIDFDRSLAGQQTMAELVACYILTTWFLDAFSVIGYLWITGERGSGKTVLLHTVAEMAYLGEVLLAGGSYASLRDLAEYGATLAFDDAESLSDPRRVDIDKRSLLLAGNRRGSTVTFKGWGPDKARRTWHVNTFCPRLFSAIQLPEKVLASRSIVIPLIRTPDRYRANADPLDAESWPHDRRELLDDLWALALASLPALRDCEKEANDKTQLTGRTQEPWRAILAVALWLDQNDAAGLLMREESGPAGAPAVSTTLWERLHTLAKRYQHERVELETDNINTLVVHALHYCIRGESKERGDTQGAIPGSAAQPERPADAYVLTTQTITGYVKALAVYKGHEDVDQLTERRVGRALGRMRFEQVPRPGGRGSRRWRVTLKEIERWNAAYSLNLAPIAAKCQT